MYRFKKKLKKLNQENRRRFIRLLFPELTQNDLTEFFLQTKNAPKFLMTDMLTHTKIHKQESLNWVISLNAILP
jgi:succinate dehydrogenase flavin-adding protein (antitoxin of CptAB toxin-antitoxin module)